MLKCVIVWFSVHLYCWLGHMKRSGFNNLLTAIPSISLVDLWWTGQTWCDLSKNWLSVHF